MKEKINKEKPILSIETSQSLCGACLYFSDNNYFESVIFQKNIHAEKLFELINKVLEEAKINVNELGSIAVSSGPGSFTGLRIGMSAVKGLAFGAQLPILPVPTFDAFALQISSYLPPDSEFIIVNKVNVEEVYFAKFKSGINKYSYIENLSILKKQELVKILTGQNYFGNANIEEYAQNDQKSINLIAPSPFFVAKWAKLFGKELLTYDYEYLEPTYIKNFIVKER